VRIFAQNFLPGFIYEGIKKSPSYNVGGWVYNRTIKKGKPMFENVINEDAIQELTPEQVDQLLSILEKAGY